MLFLSALDRHFISVDDGIRSNSSLFFDHEHIVRVTVSGASL